VLSPAGGIRAQTFRIKEKIRAFFSADMRSGGLMGRNSATGFRTDVFRICSMVTHHRRFYFARAYSACAQEPVEAPSTTISVLVPF